MKKTLGAASIALAILVLVLCSSCQSAGIAGGQATAEGIARDMVYGTENDEVKSAQSPTNKAVINPNPAVVDATVVHAGKLSGTATVVHNMVWTETDPLGIDYNRTFSITGTRTVAFDNYSNVATRVVKDGSIVVTVSSGTFQSSTASALPPVDGDTVTRTATNVQKQLSGATTLLVRGVEYACALDLSVTVVSRVTDWTWTAAGGLSNPAVQSRHVLINGTVTVNGVAYAVDRTVSVTAVE